MECFYTPWIDAIHQFQLSVFVLPSNSPAHQLLSTPWSSSACLADEQKLLWWADEQRFLAHVYSLRVG